MLQNHSREKLELGNTYLDLPKVFYSHQKPVPVSQAEMVCFNDALAEQLNLTELQSDQQMMAQYFSGNRLARNTTPIAQAYAGHQFGHFTILGDGRAVLLGERLNKTGERFDIQLKGSGPTPYSRRGDGRATLYSMLREYLISEAMHHLGIPTSRSLAVVSTGEPVYREEERQGAVLTRVARSHIRVGTFEYARNFGSLEDLKTLTTYTIKRHYPNLMNSDNPALELLKKLMDQQIDLIVNWMRVGFIHGVMNTDNMSIAGETIDYGPCAFMNAYDPQTVFSSIDRNGRYAFGNQPKIVQWNLTAFANALFPLISEDEKEALKLAQSVIDSFQTKFNAKWYDMMFAKLGILKAEVAHKDVVENLLSLMKAHEADYTHVFLALQDQKGLNEPLFKQETFRHWHQEWKTMIANGDMHQSLALMQQTNPRVIPRNHWVESALNDAVSGNMEPFHDLLNALKHPYSQQADEKAFEAVPRDFDSSYQTFCGT